MLVDLKSLEKSLSQCNTHNFGCVDTRAQPGTGKPANCPPRNFCKHDGIHVLHMKRFFTKLCYLYVNFFSRQLFRIRVCCVILDKTINRSMYHAAENSQHRTGDKLWGVSCEVKPYVSWRWRCGCKCDLTPVLFLRFLKGCRGGALGCQHHFPYYVWYFLTHFHKNASFHPNMLYYLNTTFAFGKQTKDNFINRKIQCRPTHSFIYSFSCLPPCPLARVAGQHP